MQYKLWAQKVLIVIALLTTLNIFLNYYTDPNFIFTKQVNDKPLKCLTYFGGPNERFLKVNYILKNKNRYNSFIFGSSRVGKINMSKMQDATFYNMTYAAGYPKEHLGIIKLFIRNGTKIKNIWIGLDDFSYAISDEKNFQWPVSRPHWKMKLKEDDTILNFYSYYLLKLVSTEDIEAKIDQLRGKKMDYYLYDLYNTGMPITDQKNQWIEAHKEKHNNDKVFLKPYVFATEDHVDECLNSLKEIKKICDDNNITLTVFINPLHKVTYLNDDLTQFMKFKEGLANITNYYDFAYINDITSNNYYYFETSHFRSIVGNMIIKSITTKDNKFGKYVTKENFTNHEIFLINNLKTSTNIYGSKIQMAKMHSPK